ncbi:MAG: UbiD family decarboxylase [Deferrisomatales bacterium]
MGFTDLRDTLEALGRRGRLMEIDAPVSPRHEAAAVLAQIPDRAVVLRNVSGHTVPVVGNLLCGREVLAWGLGVEPQGLVRAFHERLASPLPPEEVARAPVQEEEPPEAPLERLLPILTHYAEDSGPFVTTALVSARNPETGAVARGIHRMELRGPRELGAALLNPPLSELYARHRAAGRPLPAAVAIGIDPVTFAAFALKGAPTADKLAVAGGLRGQPVPVVRARLTGIPVPARAEFLLEGELDPADERDDGPMGEIGGYARAFPKTPTFRVRRVTHRPSPLYHALLPAGPEGDRLLAVTAEAFLPARVGPLFPFVRRLHVVPNTLGSSVVIQMAPAPRESVRSALVHLLSLGPVKKAVAVAEDVDPGDPGQVEWALATRFQADRDAVVLEALRGLPIDPSCPRTFQSAKLALDATGFERVQRHRRATIPAEALRAARELLRERRPHG